jgi:hypothetical protein
MRAAVSQSGGKSGLKPWRRITGWLALLGVILYGLTPAFACLAPRAAPMACLTAAVHQCACRPDPHGEKSCCCAEKNAATDCGVSKLPCDGGSAPEAARTVTVNPLSPAPAGISILRLTRVRKAAPWRSPSPRALAADPTVPPPRLQSAIS